MASQTEELITLETITKEEKLYLSNIQEHSMGRINALHLLSILKNHPMLFRCNSSGHISFMNNPYKRLSLKQILTYLFRTAKVYSIPPRITRTYQICALLKISPGIIMNTDARRTYLNYYTDGELHATYHTGVTNQNDAPINTFEPLDPADKIS